jgi:hypothetical protein
VNAELRARVLGEFLKSMDPGLLADYATLDANSRDGVSTADLAAERFDVIAKDQRPAVPKSVFAKARRLFVIDWLTAPEAAAAQAVVAGRWQHSCSQPRPFIRFVQARAWLSSVLKGLVGAAGAGVLGWLLSGAILGPKLLLTSQKATWKPPASADPRIGKLSALI